MLRFRPATESLGPVTDLLAIGQLIDDAMRPGNFFVAPDLKLTWIAAKSETIRWEVFRGRLMDAAQTREEKAFLSWHVIEENATEPTISVKLDVHERQIHVTRGLLCYAHEAYDAGGGVIESREVKKWVRELVGTIHLADFDDREPLRDELICLTWQAIVGTSRLPLTSVEAPLPAFSFGQLHYGYRANAATFPLSQCEELSHGLAALGPEMAKLLEFSLRHVNPTSAFRVISAVAGPITRCSEGWRGWVRFWKEMFNNASLSPHTCLIHNALIASAIGLPPEERSELDSYLLCQIGRHLLAYDLITFHHRGANYPDALLLDALLKRLLQTAEMSSESFLGSEPDVESRRRAMRQACLTRRFYEAHLVPDLPTSPGENARVMPATHPRVPDQQLTQSIERHRRLFADDPLTGLISESCRVALAQSVADLVHLDERVEMGLGLFIDRPLGYAKAIGEPDLTPMIAHEAFSPSIARRRWQELKKLCAEINISDVATLDSLFEHGSWPAGLPHAEVAECPRPVAALCDVRKVADDFVILRTKPVGLARMLEPYRLLETLHAQFRLPSFQSVRLCVPSQTVVALYDDQLRRRVEIQVDVSKGYGCRAGVEYPRAGLRVTAVWEDTELPGELIKRETNLHCFV
jgi:hypothetical protein